MENDKKENSDKVKEKVDDTEKLEEAEDAKTNNVVVLEEVTMNMDYIYTNLPDLREKINSEQLSESTNIFCNY